MRVLIDMNLSPSWVDCLAGAGHEAAHWSKLGAAEAPDSVIFDYAAEHGYVIFTHDLDFGAILPSSGANGPIVIQIRENEVDPRQIGEQVLLAIKSSETELQQGALVTVDFRRSKLRILPIRKTTGSE